MAFQDAIGPTTSEADTDESAAGQDGPRGAGSDPFSMTWDTDKFDVSDQTVDRALSILVAASHLL